MTSGHTSERSIAIVTGAGSGIGRATAGRLAGEGWGVVLVGRRSGPLEETKRLVEAAGGAGQVVCADVGCEGDAELIVSAAAGGFGRCDALINNAGAAPLLPIDRHSDELIRSTYEVNALGPARLIARVWPVMQAQRCGCIVNVSTVGTRDPFPGFFAYAASKAAVNLMAQSIASEGAEHGIRGFAVGPGAVETPMLRGLFDASVIPSDQCLSPEAVANVIVDCVLGRRDGQNGETIYLTAT